MVGVDMEVTALLDIRPKLQHIQISWKSVASPVFSHEANVTDDKY